MESLTRSCWDSGLLPTPLPQSRKSGSPPAQVSGCSRAPLLLPLPMPSCSRLREEGHLWATGLPLRVQDCSRPVFPGLRVPLTWSIGNQAISGCSGVPDAMSSAGHPSGPAPWTEEPCLPGSIPLLGCPTRVPLTGVVIPVVWASGTGQECSLEGGPLRDVPVNLG